MASGAQMTARDEWRAGWPVVVAGAVGIGVTSLHFYSLGLFIQPLGAEYGWSRAAISSGPAIVATVNLMIAARIGRLVDRVGVRRVAIPGYVAYCSGLGLLGLAGPSIWSWYALWVLLGSVAVASRFDRSRGLALAVALCGTGVAGASTLVFGSRVLDRFGWQATYGALGCTVLILGLPLLWAFLHSARDLQLKRPSGGMSAQVEAPGLSFGEALRHARFWMLAISAMLIGGGVAGLIVHFIPMGIQRGIMPVDAAAIGGLIGMAAIVGRLITGTLMDHMPARLVGGCVFLLPVLACFLLASGISAMPLMTATAVIIGLATGAEFDVLAILVSRYLGMRAYAAIYGQIAALFGIGVGFGPTIGGALFDMFGSYEPMLWFLAVLFAIAAALLFLLGPAPHWGERRD
jgi:predicted MFS family arabinose efflux permease